tara:strand:- start:3784 stop:4038 length:255 start_codon:yes stop_codon:yes gene_type:complete
MDLSNFRGKHRRSKLKIYQYLEKVGEASTKEIYQYLKQFRNSNQTMNIICNILARSRHFEVIGWVDEYHYHGRNRGYVWGLANE